MGCVGWAVCLRMRGRVGGVFCSWQWLCWGVWAGDGRHGDGQMVWCDVVWPSGEKGKRKSKTRGGGDLLTCFRGHSPLFRYSVHCPPWRPASALLGCISSRRVSSTGTSATQTHPTYSSVQSDSAQCSSASLLQSPASSSATLQTISPASSPPSPSYPPPSPQHTSTSCPPRPSRPRPAPSSCTIPQSSSPTPQSPTPPFHTSAHRPQALLAQASRRPATSGIWSSGPTGRWTGSSKRDVRYQRDWD